MHGCAMDIEHDAALSLQNMKRQPLLSILLSCAFCQALTAQYIAPRQPDDNITAVFTESPLTWQFQQLSTDSVFLRGYGVVWDTTQQAWGDTILLLEQSAEPYQGGLKFAETIRSKTLGSTWLPARRTEVFNPDGWLSNQKTKPDSVFHFTWDAGLASWALQKKIVYEKDLAGYVTLRSTYLSGHAVADTLEQFWVDTFWSVLLHHRLAYDFQSESYMPIDSTDYFFFTDTFSPSGRTYTFQTGQAKPFRRYDFKFFNILDTYELRTDFWSEEIDFWKAYSSENQVVLPNQFWFRKQYVIFTPMGQKKYRANEKYYYPDWSPKQFDYQYHPSLETFPDSVIRRDYLKDSNTGLISTIIERFQPRYEYVEFFNRFKWEFAWGAAPTVSAGQPTAAPAKARVSRVDRGVFMLDFGTETTGRKQLRLFDTSGKLLKTWHTADNTMEIDLSTFPAGIFYLHITDGRASQTVPLAVF